MNTNIYTHALTWELIDVDYPHQNKYVKDFHSQIWYTLSLISRNTNIPTTIIVLQWP